MVSRQEKRFYTGMIVRTLGGDAQRGGGLTYVGAMVRRLRGGPLCMSALGPAALRGGPAVTARPCDPLRAVCRPLLSRPHTPLLPLLGAKPAPGLNFTPLAAPTNPGPHYMLQTPLPGRPKPVRHPRPTPTQRPCEGPSRMSACEARLQRGPSDPPLTLIIRMSAPSDPWDPPVRPL